MRFTRLRFRVLVVSAFWLDGTEIIAQWAMWAALFVVVLAPAERWLGTKRWIAVVAVAHIGTTLLIAGRLWLAIERGGQPAHLEHAVDVGVSYAFAGVLGVLTYRLPGRWRWPYAAALGLAFSGLLALDPDFTASGHLTALLIGFALYPVAARANRAIEARASRVPAATAGAAGRRGRPSRESPIRA